MPQSFEYISGFVADGLDRDLKDAERRVEQGLPAADAQRLGTWTVTEKKCNGPAFGAPTLLTSVSKATHELCIDPLFVSWLFVDSVDGPNLVWFSNLLQQRYNIDPATFNGSYEQARLGFPGLKRNDWNTLIVGMGDGGISNFRASAVYLLAYIDYCDILIPTDPNCAKLAATRARVIDGNLLEATALVTALDHDVRTYDSQSWGFAALSDGSAVLNVITNATGTIPKRP